MKRWILPPENSHDLYCAVCLSEVDRVDAADASSVATSDVIDSAKALWVLCAIVDAFNELIVVSLGLFHTEALDSVCGDGE